MLTRTLRESAGLFARRAALAVADRLYPPKVAAVRNNVVTINRGTDGGVEVGQVWTAYRTDGPLTDPDTGATLGAIESPIGRVRVTEVRENFSQAVPLDAEDFFRGMILRRDRTAPPADTDGGDGGGEPE